MITDKKYTEYKESTIDWLGIIPKHWNTKRIKDLFEISRGRVISKEIVEDEGRYPVYSSQTKNNGILGYIDSYDFSGNYLTWTTDGANAGTVFIRKGEFNCTNVCGLLKIKKEQEKHFDLRFLYHIIKVIAKENKRDDINGGKLMSNEMGNLKIFYPASIEEQKAIAYFLDDKVGGIETLIYQLEKEYKSLNDLKRKIINNEVSEVFGEEQKKVRFIDEIKLSPSGVTEYKGTKEYLSTGSISENGDIAVEGEYTYAGRPSRANMLPVMDSIWFARMKSTRKSLVFTQKEDVDRFLISTGMCGFTVKKSNDLDFFKLVISSDFFLEQKDMNAYGTTQEAISNAGLKNILIYKPKLEEQKNIAKRINEKIFHIDKAKNKIKEQKQNLIDYKKVLINDVVTGKIKVYKEELN